MAARIDPTKAKLFPEELPEAIVTTASASGAAVASYSNFSPYSIFLKQLMTGQTPGVTLRLDNDSGHAVLENPLRTRLNRAFAPVDIVSYDSLDLWMIGDSAQEAFETYCAYTMRITKMTLFEKYKYGVNLSDEELALLVEFDVPKKYRAGLLRFTEAPQFKKVFEVARRVTVGAASNNRIGKVINVRRGEKAVILGVAVDAGAVQAEGGGPGADNTYITLNRDSIDAAHFKLDCAAMPPFDTEVPCYVPALDRHELIIESTAGITDLDVRFRYGIADLSIIEQIRWERPLTKDEKAIADSLDLYDSVRVGVI